MANSSRPEHLPDYDRPPLNEVVLGVQFQPAKGYKQILAGQVWDVFRPKYPLVEEVQPIPPAFEVFGAPSPVSAINFGLVSGARHDRFWFLSSSRDELIQFQHDRLLHNWRKVGDHSNQYPRFENMIENFEGELRLLEEYFQSLEPQALACNQAEISYINHIKFPLGGEREKAGEWLRFLNFIEEPDDASCVARRVLTNAEKHPIGRLTCEMNYVRDPRSGATIVLNLTVRGAPATQSIDAAMLFLKMGREVIVEEFTAITTDSAHKFWGRLR